LKEWLKEAPGFNTDKVQTPIRLVALGNESVLSLWEWYVGLTLQKKAVQLIEIPDAPMLNTFCKGPTIVRLQCRESSTGFISGSRAKRTATRLRPRNIADGATCGSFANHSKSKIRP
jgi:hypothetical protein